MVEVFSLDTTGDLEVSPFRMILGWASASSLTCDFEISGESHVGGDLPFVKRLGDVQV